MRRRYFGQGYFKPATFWMVITWPYIVNLDHVSLMLYIYFVFIRDQSLSLCLKKLQFITEENVSKAKILNAFRMGKIKLSVFIKRQRRYYMLKNWSYVIYFIYTQTSFFICVVIYPLDFIRMFLNFHIYF